MASRTKARPVRRSRQILTIRDYPALLPPDRRAALARLRKIIRVVVPDAEECIVYQVCGFRLHDKIVAAFGVARTHCSFFLDQPILAAHAKQLAGFDFKKGTIRFQPGHELPEPLVRKMVKVAADEIRERLFLPWGGLARKA